MAIVGVVGMPGSGKTEAAKVAKNRDIPVVRMGDVIRKEIKKRGMEINDENMGKIATELRKKKGEQVIAKRCIEEIHSKINSDSNIVFIDGIRSWNEVDFFKEEFGDSFILVSIESPFEKRLVRIKNRNREGGLSKREELKRRDKREKEYSMKKAMKNADIVIKNTGSLSEYREKISDLLEEI